MADVVAVSLFSGAGGLDLGAGMAGVRVVSCLDFDADSVATLAANSHFRDAALFHADISQFDLAPIRDRVRAEAGAKCVVIGGPPCQPFSKNGYWIKNENRLAMRDPRNMIHQFFRVVEELQPDGFLLENVESILHPTNKEAVAFIGDEAARLGFSHKMFRVNAADFGVPQRRKRVFFVGSRRVLNGEAPLPTHRAPGEETHSNLPIHRGVGEFLEPYSSDQYFEPHEDASRGTFYGDLLQVPRGKNYMAVRMAKDSDKPKYRPGSRFWNFLLKLHPEQPSWTIPANPGPWVGPFHWENRRLRVPEVAAIQTFPNGYKFVGNRRSVQKQLGNAVPPLLGKSMVAFLKDHV